VQNYLTNKQTIISPLILHLLSKCDLRYYTMLELNGIFKDLPEYSKILDKLIDSDIFLIKDSYFDQKDNSLYQIWTWQHDAKFFHYSTQYTEFEDDLQKENLSLIKLAKEIPAPDPFKNYETPSVDLLYVFDQKDDDFFNILKSRRTIRRYSKESISLENLSAILLFTWGKTKEFYDSDIGKYIVKTSPSGGSRHPTEVYPVVLRVNGIDPGIYHYSVQKHTLELIKLGYFENLVVELCANQHWVSDSAVVFFMTSRIERNMWKYSQSHAYRVILLDAGHLGQTFHLVCTKLGLAPFTTAATNDHQIEKELGLDGISEIAVYTACVGIPLH
jgi:SagB-type dehydrogenase family enzyme